MTHALLQQALADLLEYVPQDHIDNKQVGNTVAAISEYLAQPESIAQKPEQQTVAWLSPSNNLFLDYDYSEGYGVKGGVGFIPLCIKDKI